MVCLTLLGKMENLLNKKETEQKTVTDAIGIIARNLVTATTNVEEEVVGTNVINSSMMQTYLKIPFSSLDPMTITINENYDYSKKIYEDIENGVYNIIKDYEAKRAPGSEVYKTRYTLQVDLYLED
jgi:hypothetical protein